MPHLFKVRLENPDQMLLVRPQIGALLSMPSRHRREHRLSLISNHIVNGRMERVLEVELGLRQPVLVDECTDLVLVLDGFNYNVDGG